MSVGAAWFIGWDVGAWHCDKGDSRDALVILNHQGKLLCKPWRGNLRSCIAQSESFSQWLHVVAGLCGLEMPSQVAHEPHTVTLAIDTPLGFSNDFVALLSGAATTKPFSKFSENPYLYRETELLLFQHGYSPLSAVKDMIGSQATKGLHFLRKFGFTPTPSGIWQLNQSSQSHQNPCQHRAFESYPTVLKTSAMVAQYIEQLRTQTHFDSWNQDSQDATYCAIAALLQTQHPELMAAPNSDVTAESWIYVPKECLSDVRKG
ncbi:hypothetical protein [Shewanella sp. GD04112]|uniref:hypothetical protein n=1 Tax=Shewanella sp. GD04112 TaxID=2975434 RepID=UPI002446EBDF|nr:hypothetical protein [Shewanella sp. GD04112]MDH0450360.1 hypothetical protein [Shewanella sp. GD04112]